MPVALFHLLLVVVTLVAGLGAQDSRPAWRDRADRERRDIEERHRIASEILASEEDRLAAVLAALEARKAEAEIRMNALRSELARQASVRAGLDARRSAAKAAAADVDAHALRAADALRRHVAFASGAMADTISKELGRIGDTASPVARRLAEVAGLTERYLLDLRTISVGPAARNGKPGSILRLGGLGTWWIPETGAAVAADDKVLDLPATSALRDLARRAARLDGPGVVRLPRGVLP